MSDLAIYVNDHLGGATSGVELARRAARNNEGSDYGPPLERLAEAIDEDHASLRILMDELEIGHDKLKEGGGWIAEKFGRLKLNGAILHYTSLGRLIEIEGLYLGVTGKLSLWENLDAAVGRERLSAVDLGNLIERAESQRSELRELRLRAAKEVFSDEAAATG